MEVLTELIATRHPKIDGKRIIARLFLQQLSLRGYMVPPQFCNPWAMQQLLEEAGMPIHSFVVLVNELSKQYRLDRPEYEIIADAAGVDFYTVKVRIGHVERIGTGVTRRLAQELAAERIYRYLRTRLASILSFDEEQGMYTAYERAMALDVDEEIEQQRRKEEEEQARRRAMKKGKNSKNSLELEVTIRMELEESENGSEEAGPKPPADKQGATVMGEYGSAEAAASAIGLGDNDAAVQFISRTLSRLGI